MINLQQSFQIGKWTQLLAAVSVFGMFTLTVAGCSEIQRNDSDSEQLINQKLDISGATIMINSREVINLERTSPTVAHPVNGILSLTLGEYGTFLVSGQKFESAKPAGTVLGNKLEFTVNELSVTITGKQQLLNQKSATLWVAHDPKFTRSEGITGIRWFTDYPKFRDYRIKKIDKRPITRSDENDYFVVVEEMPELIGGLSSIQSRIQYPETAKKAGIEGRVIVQFIVNEQGDVTNPEIIRGIGGGCDEEALSAVRQATFKPGKQDGEPVRVQFSLPVQFKL